MSVYDLHTKIGTGVPVVLTNLTGGANKYYIFWLYKPKDSLWTLHLHYGKIGTPGITRTLVTKQKNNWNALYGDVYEECLKLLREKTNKGYIFAGTNPFVATQKKNCPVNYPQEESKEVNVEAITNEYDDILL